MHKISSEIYEEGNFLTNQAIADADNGRIVSIFTFQYPSDDDGGGNDGSGAVSVGKVAVDTDGDLMVERRSISCRKSGQLTLEHFKSTYLDAVGLQIWRAGFLLADYCFYKRRHFENMNLIELGAGIGLTSIAAAIYVKNVVCTDVNRGGILDLIKSNIHRNIKLLKGHHIEVAECDFLANIDSYSAQLLKAIDDSDIVLAADVIYDVQITEAFVRLLDAIFARGQVAGRRKCIYIGVEKRYVFTLADLDAVAPMFDNFLQLTRTKAWHIEFLDIDFPQYFNYKRTKELVLMQVTNNE